MPNAVDEKCNILSLAERYNDLTFRTTLYFVKILIFRSCASLKASSHRLMASGTIYAAYPPNEPIVPPIFFSILTIFCEKLKSFLLHNVRARPRILRLMKPLACARKTRGLTSFRHMYYFSAHRKLPRAMSLSFDSSRGRNQ